MDLESYVENLRRSLVVAADAGGDEARALAERLTGPLESATRLALLDALSAAADEITRDLAPGSVEVRLRGGEPEFAVTSPPAEEDFETAPRARSTPLETDDGGTSRITLRLPEHLKPRINEAAAEAGISVNAWLVRAVAAALETDDRGRRAQPPRGRGFTGWVR
jgi:HicB family